MVLFKTHFYPGNNKALFVNKLFFASSNVEQPEDARSLATVTVHTIVVALTGIFFPGWKLASLSRFLPKTELFAPDTASVYTTTPKIVTENGAIRKRSPDWSDLKTMLFENAVF